MSVTKGELLYEGKAKRIYKVPSNENVLWVEFKDSLTAFNAAKKGSFAAKGILNKQVTSLIFRYLKKAGVMNHWQEDVSDREMICTKLEIIPLEVVVRNRLAGSTAKKFNLEEGTPLAQPLVEFYYKSDPLNDPFISDDQALMLKAVKDREELDELRRQALLIDGLLQKLFAEVGIELIDFKLEFGKTHQGKIILGDEISPDCCRLWDMKSGEKLDKDRFRRDLGRVEESYQEVWQRLQKRWENQV